MESILTSIKKMIGMTADYTSFDTDVIIHINSAFMILHQLGVGPQSPIVITSELETWNNKFGDTKDIEGIKTYVYLKVRLVFDPPTNSAVLEAMKNQINELEFRLSAQSEFSKKEG